MSIQGRFINWCTDTIDDIDIIVGKFRTESGSNLYFRFPIKSYILFKQSQAPSDLVYLDEIDLDEITLIKDNSANIKFPRSLLQPSEEDPISVPSVEHVIIRGYDQITYRRASVRKNDLVQFTSNPIRWFFILSKLEPMGYYQISDSIIGKDDNIDIKNVPNIFISIPAMDIPLNLLSYDIEVENDGTMPTPNDPKFKVTHIGFEWYSNRISKRYCLINSDMLPDVTEANVNSAQDILDYYDPMIFLPETKMLQYFAELMAMPEVDVILTFNGHNFDFPYLEARYRRLCNTGLMDQNTNPIAFHTNQLKSEMVANIPNSDLAGIYFDIYIYIHKVFTTYDQYSLRYVASKRFNNMVTVVEKEDHVYKLEMHNPTHIFLQVLSSSSNAVLIERDFEILEKEDDYIVVKPLNLEIELEMGKEYEVSLTKDAIEISHKDTYKDYDYNKSIIFAKYCLHDALLCRYIYQIDNVEHGMSARCTKYRTTPNESFIRDNSQNVLGELINSCLERKMWIEETCGLSQEYFQGGKVFDPTLYRSENYVLVYDFLSLYPSTIKWANLSPETIVASYITYNKWEMDWTIDLLKQKYPHTDFSIAIITGEQFGIITVFDKRIEGMIPYIITKGMEERSVYKKQMKEATSDIDKNYYDAMQYTTKIHINSIYGLLGSQFFKFSSKIVSQSCTALSRASIEYMVKMMDNSTIKDNVIHLHSATSVFTLEETTGGPVEIFKDSNKRNYTLKFVYGDTDSAMFALEGKSISLEEAISVGKAIEIYINRSIIEEKGAFEFENIFKPMIFLKKKKYFGINAKTNKFYFKGISLGRRDYTRLHKEIIKQIVDMLIANDSNIQIVEYIKRMWMREISSKPKLENYYITGKYHQTYKGSTNLGIPVAKFNIKYPDDPILPGNRFMYVILDGKKTEYFRSIQVIRTFDDALDGKLGYSRYFERICNDAAVFLRCNPHDLFDVITRFMDINTLDFNYIEE